MLIEAWLDRPVPLIFGALALALAGTGLLVFALTFAPGLRRRTATLAGVVAPFFGSISILFGLTVGFLANDAWERNRQAARAILAERDAVVAIHDLSLATVSDMAPIRAALRAYLHAVIGDEWALQREGHSSPKARAALGTLLRTVADPVNSAGAGPVAHAALLDLSMKLRSARSDRLALSELYSDGPKWWAVFALAVLTQLALGIVHLDRPRAQLSALALFSLAGTVAIGLVAMKERPFDGPLGLEPTALQVALQELAPVSPPPNGPAPGESSAVPR